MSMVASVKWKHENGKHEEARAAGGQVAPGRWRAALWLLWLLAGLTHKARLAEALRLNSIEVPPAVMNSSSQVMLICNFDLQGDQLYSVKWYKNYVEFYRFQPTPEGSGEPHSKLELELDGISLNLARSNATHVCLRQVALQSEGTYKCEVSAESPSFATVSLERQMKVYVLPKQKLTIVDNQALLNENQPAAVGSQLQLTYAVNDLVNLTCLAASSRPAAKLRWLLNDWPVPAASKWLSYGPSGAAGGQGARPLAESRLTLAFRLQPSHLLNTPSVRLKAAAEPDSQRANQQLRLKCLALLSAEFATESQVLVSGAKASSASGKKQQQQQQKVQRLPTPESLALNTPAAHSLQLLPANQSEAAPTNYPVYRWPRPQHHKFAAAGGFRRAQSTTPEPLVGDTTQPAGGELEPPATARPQPSGRPATSGRGSSGSGLLGGARVASRELRAQADHIEQLLRWSQPNKLGAPIIERGPRLNSSAPPEPEAGEGVEEGVASTPAAGSADGDEETSESSWEADGQLATPPPDGAKAVAGVHITRSSSSSAAGAQFNGEQAWPSSTPASEWAQHERDYELNEVAQFRCRAQFAATAGANPAAESTRRLRLKWLINNSELTTSLVNAFDGSRFYYAQRAPQSEPRGPQKEWRSANGSAAFDLDSVESKGAVAPPGGEAQSELLVEFAAQLFQMKELLTLGCRALVEQPLIEFEALALVSVEAHAQFVEAEPSNKQQRLSGANGARNSTAGSGYQLRAHRTQPNSRSRARQPAPGSGSGAPREAGASNLVQLAASLWALLAIRASSPSQRSLFTFLRREQ